jgi:hypothetical protein
LGIALSVQQFFYADRENADEAGLCVGMALFFCNSVTDGRESSLI